MLNPVEDPLRRYNLITKQEVILDVQPSNESMVSEFTRKMISNLKGLNMNKCVSIKNSRNKKFGSSMLNVNVQRIPEHRDVLKRSW